MVIRNILKERITLMFIIHAAAIMLRSVADNQVIYFQYHIIRVIWSKTACVISMCGALYSTIIRADKSLR